MDSDDAREDKVARAVMAMRLPAGVAPVAWGYQCPRGNVRVTLAFEAAGSRAEAAVEVSPFFVDRTFLPMLALWLEREFAAAIGRLTPARKAG